MLMKRLKYVVLNWLGDERVIILPTELNHDFVVPDDLNHPGCVVSAGYCTLESNGAWVCNGASQGLGVNARVITDSILINVMLGTKPLYDLH